MCVRKNLVVKKQFAWEMFTTSVYVSIMVLRFHLEDIIFLSDAPASQEEGENLD